MNLVVFFLTNKLQIGHFEIRASRGKNLSKNENNIVSDIELREGNDQVEGVEIQEAVEEAESVSKGTKNGLKTIVKN